MTKQSLVKRLTAADPGWPVWTALVKYVRSLDFEVVRHEHLGEFIAAEDQLSFGVLSKVRKFPKFTPVYVEALFDMKPADPEMDGGYACCLNFGELAQRGTLFSPAGNDDELGFPLFDPPPHTYLFQTNSSGALLFINRKLEVVVPDPESESFVSLDPLEEFTQVCIQSAIDGDNWFSEYSDHAPGLID
jgi:hypothetical protein